MRILAVETATLQGSIALVGEQGVLAEVRSEEGMTHAAWLMPAIERLFRMTALSLDQIDGLAVSAGPGSFTGLRIGLSTVKGLALGAGKPVVAIDTLDVLAQAVPPCRRLVCPIVDARKKEVYAALYGSSEGDGLRRLTPDMVLPPQHLAERIDAAVLFVGNGIEPYRSVLSRTLGHRALFASQRFRYPRAAVVAQLGLARLARGRTDVLETLEPLYVRPSEAELKKRHRGMS